MSRADLMGLLPKFIAGLDVVETGPVHARERMHCGADERAGVGRRTDSGIVTLGLCCASRLRNALVVMNTCTAPAALCCARAFSATRDAT